MTSIVILNGPNLNLLGRREPEIYGSSTLGDIEELCRAAAEPHAIAIEFSQSNHEGELVELIQAATLNGHNAVVINPAGYTHTSVAIADALTASGLPVIEVHLTNIHSRESFRANSFVSPIAIGVICGFGPVGYKLAIDAVAQMLSTNRS
ncbi:MAG: type II 3-dehydroquinate dehydratase [Rhodobacteraceae bacterium]|nr:type II 3-dehydroquinate dehydratase [Paracoccaceae bacterium]